MIRFLLVLILIVPHWSYAQFTYRENLAISVTRQNGDQLDMPWMGGFNSPQFSSLDLDGDNVNDLIVFDRMADKLLSFLSRGNSYEYAPEYEVFFPEAIERFVLLYDYNCDGKNDLFTAHPLGISVYTNVTVEGSTPEWKQYFFTTNKRPVIYTKGFQLSNLQIQFDDLPAFADADGDGDMDIFTPRFPTGTTIEYHQNFSMERYGRCDSLEFERVTQEWGGITECDCGTFALQNQPCPTGGRTQHQGGKSLLALDANGDDKIDLVFGEAECPNLFLFPNTGTANVPIVSEWKLFPEENPVNISYFPAAFYEDVNFDGIRELLSAPNIYAREFPETDLRASAWLYTNSGTNENPVFNFASTSFLQSESIDVGENAVPSFGDIDGDGDEDLLISSYTSNEGISRIYVYQNEGTSTEPAFNETATWFFTIPNYFNVKIAFADMNRDGRPDLTFTGTLLSNPTTTHFAFVRNTRNSGILLETDNIEMIPFALTQAENLSYVDVDRDGFIDILAGRSSGRLEYWRNNGGSNPSFALESNTFIEPIAGQPSQYPSAVAGDLNADGKTDLVIGDQAGRIQIIDDFRSQQNRSIRLTDVVYNEILEEYGSRNFGGRIWPTLANLVGTNKPQIITGTSLGGLRILQHDDQNELDTRLQVQMLPNFTTADQVVTITADRAVSVKVFNSLGQIASDERQLSANENHQVTFSNLKPGLYFVRFNSNAGSATRRLIIY